MVKRLHWLIPLLALLCLPARLHAQFFPAQGWCEDGNKNAVTSGLNSTNTLQASYPLCTVAVAIHGGGTATIYSDEGGTPLANPFTASTNGQWEFFADPGRYDVTISGGTPIALPAPVTFASTLILAGSGVSTFSSGNLSPLFTTNVANPTTAPALSFTLSTAAANTVFGNCTGSLAAPSFCAASSSMITPPGSTTQVIYNLGGAFAASQDMTWDNTTKTFSIKTSGSPIVRLLSDSGAGKLLFGTGTAPFIRDNSGSGWIFTSLNGQDLIFGTVNDQQSILFGGDNVLPHGAVRFGIGAAEGAIYLNDGSSGAGLFQGPVVQSGSGSPEGAFSAGVSSLFLRGDGGIGTTLYIKQAGTGSTGWDAVSCIAAGTCISSVFYGDDGLVGTPTYSFTTATSSGMFWTGAQVAFARGGVTQFSTNSGPGLTSAGSLCAVSATRCITAGTATTSGDPYLAATGGAIMFSVPLVAGNPTTTGWGAGERGGVYLNTTSTQLRYWNGAVLRDTGALIFDCGTTTTCANTATTAARTIIGSVALTTGTPSTAVVTGISPAFTSTASFRCVVTEATDATKNLLKIVNTSTSSITITGPDTITDTVSYLCAGS